MLFKPVYKLNIIGEEEFPQAILKIEEEISACRNQGFMETSDKKQLYYEYYLAENSKGTIVLVHGLSEFSKKFYEATYYFLDKLLKVLC